MHIHGVDPTPVAPKKVKKTVAKKTIIESVENKIRAAVSKKKRRLQEDSFDLDLSYILGNVISMGYPATGMEGIYRNKITDVKKFLDQRHYGRYRLYNLCSERMYDHSLFEGRVNHKFRFNDHHPPPMKHFAPFVASVANWLNADKEVTLVALGNTNRRYSLCQLAESIFEMKDQFGTENMCTNKHTHTHTHTHKHTQLCCRTSLSFTARQEKGAPER